MTVTNRLNTMTETSQRLCCSRTSLYRLIDQGRIRTVRIGRRQLIPDSEIERFIATSLEPALEDNRA